MDLSIPSTRAGLTISQGVPEARIAGPEFRSARAGRLPRRREFDIPGHVQLDSDPAGAFEAMKFQCGVTLF